MLATGSPDCALLVHVSALKVVEHLNLGLNGARLRPLRGRKYDLAAINVIVPQPFTMTGQPSRAGGV